MQGVYYVKKVLPTHLRLVHLFTGEERTLPPLDNLSTLQVQLQTHQLAKVSDTLFRANRYLSPDQSKTWNYLLNKDRQHISSGIDLQSEYDNFIKQEEQPDTSTLDSPELPTDSKQVTELPGHDKNQLIPTDDNLPAKDVFNNPLDPVDETLIRRTRSGKTYSLDFESSILKIKKMIFNIHMI